MIYVKAKQNTTPSIVRSRTPQSEEGERIIEAII